MVIYADGVDPARAQNSAQCELCADAVAVGANVPEHRDAPTVEFFQKRFKACAFFRKMLVRHRRSREKKTRLTTRKIRSRRRIS